MTATIEPISRAETARRPLRVEDCVLAVIDIQEKLLPRIHENGRVLNNSQLLIRLANILGLPVVVTTQYSKGLGPTVPEVLSLLADAHPVDKLEFGCFGNGEFCSRVGPACGPKHSAPVRNRNAHLRDAVSAWSTEPGIERPRGRGRRRLPRRAELGARARTHAECRVRDLFC
jgi:hypothetical protein